MMEEKADGVVPIGPLPASSRLARRTLDCDGLVAKPEPPRLVLHGAKGSAQLVVQRTVLPCGTPTLLVKMGPWRNVIPRNITRLVLFHHLSPSYIALTYSSPPSLSIAAAHCS